MLQSSLTAGDTLSFSTVLDGYPAGAGWVLKYRLVPRTGSNPAIAITASADGDSHRVLVDAATTGAWVVDSYTWNSWVEKSGEVYSIASGQLGIQADPRTVAAGLDGRSSARKALDAADAALAAYGSKAYLQAYEINGRSQKFHSPSEFLAWRSALQREVRREDAAADMAAGRGSRNKIFVRVPRA